MSSIGNKSWTAIVITCLALVMAAAPAFAKQKHSGFLDDYSKLKKEKDALGAKRLIWLNPKFTGTNYQKVLIEPVVFYPEPQATEHVSDDVLQQIRDYIDNMLRESVGAELPLTDEPGKGVARLRLAITAVSIEKGLKLRELLPSAMIRAGVKEAAGVRKHPVDLFVESEITDSVTKETLALSVREAKGIVLKGKDDLTLEDAKSQIDQWGEAVRQEVVKRLK